MLNLRAEQCYFKIQNDQIQITKKRREKANLEELTKFFSNPNCFQSEVSQDFIVQWPELKKKLQRKRSFCFSYLVDYIFNLFGKKFINHRDTSKSITCIDNSIASYYHQKNIQNLEDWLSNPEITGDKLKAAARTKKVMSNPLCDQLDLSQCDLSELPDMICTISHLKKIDLRSNRLKKLPESFGNLINLQNLKLGNNQLTRLPESFGNLINLLWLELKNNQLTRLPESFENLINLQDLNLSNNQFTKLPENFGKFILLKKLDLSNNQFTELSLDFSHHIELETLRLRGNQIKKIPENIGQLNNLKELNLSNNQLTEIPISIADCINLNHLEIANNPGLRNIPLSLERLLPNLTYIDLLGTGIELSVILEILKNCQALRKQIADQKFPFLFKKWLEIAYGKIPEKNKLEVMSETNLLSKEEKGHLYEWLIRLEQTNEFKHSQKELAQKTCEMIRAFNQFPAFKEQTIAQLIANNSNCQDRAAMSYNEIYLSYCLHTLPKGASLTEKLELMVRAAYTKAVMNRLTELLNKHEKSQGRKEAESVEIYLYYVTAVAKDLNLLLGITNMRYREIGKRRWIDESKLIIHAKKAWFEALISFPIFEKLLEESESFKEKIEEETTKAQIRLDDLDENSPTYAKDANKIGENLNQFKKDLLREEGKSLLINNRLL